MHELGCDFYASSPHKWLMAPKGTGFLYVREELCDKLWVNIASGEWRNYAQKAYRFSNLGTSNLSVMVGLKAALDFFKEVGPERIYARSHQLATRVRDHVAKYPERMKTVNASRDEFFGTLVSFEPVPAVPPGATSGGLAPIVRECAARNVRVAGGAERIRIATHIFTQPTELSLFFDALDAGVRSSG
jgi:selenocysteine lyase/cysteine desulfurase